MSSKPALESYDADGVKKKRKIDESDDFLSPQAASVFKNFKVHKVLREDLNSKLVTLQGYFLKGDPNDSEEGQTNVEESSESERPPAVVLLERKPFNISTLEHSLQPCRTKQMLKNDIYNSYDVFSSGNDADLKATVIYPATEKHISKYSEHEPYIVRETPELYKSVTLPCLESSQFSVQWVYNILEKKSESDRIIVEDPDPEIGFIIVPDMKWDRKNVDTLYLVALVHKHGIKSIRDLRKEHLPLLHNILNKGQKAIKELYGVPASKLRVFFHYQPSYYHLHVHFTHIKWEPPGFHALRAHMFDDVVENLQMDSEFYCKKTISFVVRDNDELFKAYKDHSYFGS